LLKKRLSARSDPRQGLHQMALDRLELMAEMVVQFAIHFLFTRSSIIHFSFS
jgi:hypothetical protein